MAVVDGFTEKAVSVLQRSRRCGVQEVALRAMTLARLEASAAGEAGFPALAEQFRGGREQDRIAAASLWCPYTALQRF